MAYSWQESVEPAGTQDIQCDIEYLDKSYIHVYLDEVEVTAFTWTSATNIRLNAPLSAETKVLLIRKTEREYLYIEFASGAPFIEGNVDTQNTQFLHLAQELVEGRAIDGFYGNINMHGYRITNLGSPVNAGDATNKGYVDSGDTALGVRIDAEANIRASRDSEEVSNRKRADEELAARLAQLESTFISGSTTTSYQWWTVLSEDTDTVTPGVVFNKAQVSVAGQGQVPGYSFEVVDNTIKFASVLRKGTMVWAILGKDSVLPSTGVGIAVANATDTASAVTQLNALLASLRGAGLIAG